MSYHPRMPPVFAVASVLGFFVVCFLLAGIFLLSAICQPVFKVVLILQIKSREWERNPLLSKRVVTLSKTVDLRALPGFDSEIHGHGLEHSKVERVILEHRSKDVDATVHLPHLKADLADIDSQVKAMTDFSHWQVT